MPAFSQNANYLEDRFSYYGPDGTVRAADYRRADGTPGQTGANRLGFEEYRYDAYGRRVWVRARRSCTGITVNVQADSAAHGECRTDLIRRTVWDGFQELAEIQQPGGDGELESVIENDTQTLERGAPDGMDENPYFGRVLYAYGLVLDQPLSLTRLGYGSIRDPDYQPVAYRAWAPFSFLPMWNHLGVPDWGAVGLGAPWCQTVGSQENCVRMRSPFAWSALNVQEFIPAYWHGTVIEDKRDKAQTLYRRNRVYDPATGRFTQEDPIGYAGGINLYGYVGNNPVMYTDPFGLCPECKLLLAAAGASAVADTPLPGPGDVVAAGLTLGAGILATKYWLDNGGPQAAADEMSKMGRKIGTAVITIASSLFGTHKQMPEGDPTQTGAGGKEIPVEAPAPAPPGIDTTQVKKPDPEKENQ